MTGQLNSLVRKYNSVCVLVCVKGKFRMNLRAQQMVDDTPVCQLSREEKASLMRVKPTTFSAAVHINASVLCPTCTCEQVLSRN